MSDSVTPWTAAPGFPILHYVPECTQTHVHWVADAIQPFHPLSPLSPPALSVSQHQGLSRWVGCSQQVAKALASASVLPMNIQGWFSLGLTGLISLQSKGLSRVFSSSTIWKHQFFRFLYGLTLTSMHDYWKRQISHITYTWKQTKKKKCYKWTYLFPQLLNWDFSMFSDPDLNGTYLSHTQTPGWEPSFKLKLPPTLFWTSIVQSPIGVFCQCPQGSLSYGDTPSSCSKLLIRQFSSWPLL